MSKLFLIFSFSLLLGATTANATSNSTHAKHHKGTTCAAAKCMKSGKCTDPSCMKDGKCTMGMHTKKSSAVKPSKTMSSLLGHGNCASGCTHAGCMGMAKKN